MLPARAGMVPCRPPQTPTGTRAPRSRGDGPVPTAANADWYACSPLARGWSVPGGPHPHRRCVLPARAGDGPRSSSRHVMRGPCSPLARGWSLHHRDGLHERDVLLARAGMVRPARSPARYRSGAPRSRGDGPGNGADGHTDRQCSPLARGWSRRHGHPRVEPAVLPARARMVLLPDDKTRSMSRAPRSRGDGPFRMSSGVMSGSCSPLVRGWSVDGPLDLVDGVVFPLVRGWSHVAVGQPGPLGVLPARAGVAPQWI